MRPGLVARIELAGGRAESPLETLGRLRLVGAGLPPDPRQVLWDEKRREDQLRELGIRFVRVADADLGTRWRSVGSRSTELLRLPGPVDRRFTARPRRRVVVRRSARARRTRAAVAALAPCRESGQRGARAVPARPRPTRAAPTDPVNI